MAKKTTKLTTFKSSESVVTEDYMNSMYGGLYGTSKQSLYSSTDPQVHGHVHDGEHLDGHVQKIHLANHVTGKLPIAFIDGTIDANPGLPLNSFQFNSADTFAGAPSLIYQSSTDNVQFSKDQSFYYGSIDNQNSYYIKHEVNSNPELNFYSESTADTVFYQFRKTTLATVDLIARFDDIERIRLYGSSSDRSTEFDLGSRIGVFAPWDNLYAKSIRLYPNNATSDQKYVQITPAVNHSQDYLIQPPIYRPTSSNQVLKTITSGSSVSFTWDNYSGGGGSYIEGLNINIINNNTIETQMDVVFGTVESARYEIGSYYNYIEAPTASEICFATASTLRAKLNNTTFYPNTDQGVALGSTSERFSELHVDNIVVDSNTVKSSNSNDLKLEANAGTNGSEITLDYAADNTADIIVETKGKGYLKSPYKNVMSEGHSGSPSLTCKSSFINHKTTAAGPNVDKKILKVEVLNQLAYGLINFDIVAAKIEKSGAARIVDLGFAKNYLMVRRDNAGTGTSFIRLDAVGEFIDTATGEERFKSMSGQIAEVRMSVDAITGGVSDTQTFNVIMRYIKTGGEGGTDDSCDFTVTAKATHIDGINIYRPE